MSSERIEIWERLNRQYLLAEINLVHLEIKKHLSGLGLIREEKMDLENEERRLEDELKDIEKALEAPSTVMKISNVFGLSGFEKKVLLLCAGLEMDSKISASLNQIDNKTNSKLPTFSLFMAAFPEAHWSALLPDGPLRHWRLIEVIKSELLTLSPIKISESILHYLTGLSQLDPSLQDILMPIAPVEQLVPSHQQIARNIVNTLTISEGKSIIPVIQLNGDDRADKLEIAHYVSGQFGLSLIMASAFALPSDQSELIEKARIWNRDSSLFTKSLYIDCEDIDQTDNQKAQVLSRFIELITGVCFVGCKNWNPKLLRYVRSYEIGKPEPDEQHKLWVEALDPGLSGNNGITGKLTSQFNLSASSILANGSELSKHSGAGEGKLEKQLIESCNKVIRPKLDRLAQRIEPVAGWDDLILPDQQKSILKEISLHVEHRLKVYQEWGFAGKSNRGLGISSLFSGDSGTGKTMAAEVIANELNLDLYKIDLSQVVNKYIGETEKNLKRIFDAADEGGTILLFDEADALFGKRSEVKDSHDRYSNIEVSYLLQRMESYRGLAILTTNMKAGLDQAFMRRIRFIVSFPFPDVSQRIEIWRGIYPENTPLKDIDFEKLGQLNVSGGNIRNIALNAAFIAASEGSGISMKHILKAARSEYQKLNKIISSAETGNW